MVLRRLSLFAFILSVALGLGVYWKREWLSGQLEAWVKRRLIQSAIDRIQPKLPFKIEHWEFDADWKDLKTKRIPRVALVLSRDSVRARLEGPLALEESPEPPTKWTVTYSPKITLEGPFLAKGLEARIDVAIPSGLERLESAEVELRLDSAAIPGLKLDLGSLEAKGSWSTAESLLRVSAEASRLSWKGAVPESQAIEVAKPSFTWEGPLRIDPPEGAEPLDGDHRAELRATGIEALFDPNYFDLTLSKWPISAKIHWAGALKSVELRSNGQRLDLSKKALDGPLAASWDIRAVPVADLAKTLAGVPSLVTLTSLQWTKGTISSKAKAILDTTRAEPFAITGGRLELRDAALRWNEKRLAARGLDLSLPIPFAADGSTAEVAIERVYFQKLGGTLPPTRLRIRSDSRGISRIETDGNLGLKIDGIPLVFGDIQAVRGEEGLAFTTSLALPSTPLERLTAPFCLTKKPLPPATFQATFPKLEVDANSIVPTGEARFSAFDGSIVIGGIAAYDYATDFPEIKFSADWDKIRLDLLGRWLGFGEMDGRLVGYAHDVLFQAWLPTHFDLLSQAKPMNRSDIVFSPEAMRNFVRLFAGEDVEQYLPGIARWFAFGWPSRVFGGYDIDYLGIRAFSNDGSILVETLDPPDPRAAANRPRYILYGPRFRMPLKSSRYPLVIDAPAMGNFVRQVIAQLDTIMKSKKKETPDEKDPPCLPPENF